MIRRIKAPTARDDIDSGLAINAYSERQQLIPVEFSGHLVGEARILGQGGEPTRDGRKIQEFLVLELSIPNDLIFHDVFLECDSPDSVGKVVLLDFERTDDCQDPANESLSDRERGLYKGLY